MSRIGQLGPILGLGLIALVARGEEGHWAFRELEKPEPPEVEGYNHPVDRYMMSGGRRSAHLQHPHVLMRRMQMDLNGVFDWRVQSKASAASPFEWNAFLDELMASPRFGERMATYWFDLVRFADTHGYHADRPFPIAPYRSWVINAFNEDMPFDQFTREQLAGDLLENPTIESLVATAYNRLNLTTEEEGAQDGEYLVKYRADRVRNVSTVWLGLTLECAECHDHFNEDLTQEDFYSFAAIFADIDEPGCYKEMDDRPPVMLVPTEGQRLELERINEALPGQVARFKELITQVDLPEAGEDIQLLLRLKPSQRSPDEQERVAAYYEETSYQLAAVRRRIDRMRIRKNEIEASCPKTVYTRSIEPREVRVLSRGDWMDRSGAVMTPGIPKVFGASVGKPMTRLDLADWMFDGGSALVARVFVGRLWELFMEERLVPDTGDFGKQGGAPNRAALIDFLAWEFRSSGWNVKHVIRLVLTSESYRLGQVGRRFEPEFLRDSALLAAGLLQEGSGGPSIFPEQPDGYWNDLGFPERKYIQTKGDERFRRSVYIHWQRTFLHPFLKVMDAPSREVCQVRRDRSNTPLSALALLNEEQMVDAAEALAEEFADDDVQRAIQQMAFRILGRVLKQEEFQVLERMVQKSETAGEGRQDVLFSLARVLLNSDAFQSRR